MTMNSYGWVILYIVVIASVGYFGGALGYTVNGLPQETDALGFLGALATFQIDGVHPLLALVFDCSPFFVAWIIYRQIRGQD